MGSVISYVAIAGAWVLSLLALTWLARIAALVSELRDLSTFAKASRVASLEERLTESEETLSQLANRVKMMRVRNAVNHVGDKAPGGIPDPRTDPDGWRTAMNSKLARSKLGL